MLEHSRAACQRLSRQPVPHLTALGNVTVEDSQRAQFFDHPRRERIRLFPSKTP